MGERSRRIEHKTLVPARSESVAHAEERERDDGAKMEQRHRVATLAVGIERVAGNADALAAFLEELRNEPIPNATKKVFASTAREYRMACEVARQQSVAREFEGMDDVVLGKTLFTQYTGFLPEKPVFARRLEGYFVLVCPSKNDYVLAASAGLRVED